MEFLKIEIESIMRTLMLLGSGEFTPALLETDRFLIEKQRRILGRDPRIVIIPTAAGQERYPEKWVSDGKRHFAKLDLVAECLMVLNREDADNINNARSIDDYDIIYFSGGHPGYLFDTLKDSAVWKRIIRNYEEGKVLAGSSAGAMIMGKYLFKNPEETFYRGEEPIFENGFGLIQSLIIPHFDEEMVEQKIFELTKFETSLLGIYENTALIINDETEGIVSGEGKVLMIDQNSRNEFSNGESVLFPKKRVVLS